MGTVFKIILNWIRDVVSKFKIVNPVLGNVAEETHDTYLVELLEDILKYPKLTPLLRDPVSKIYVITTYSTSYNDLGTMLIDKRYNRKLMAINLHSYFNGEEDLVPSGLARIVTWMKGNKLTVEASHDLYEIASTIKHLLALKGEYDV